jgi:hypothetical protein
VGRQGGKRQGLKWLSTHLGSKCVIRERPYHHDPAHGERAT